MLLDIYLRDTLTGATHVYQDPIPVEEADQRDLDSKLYLYQEGNYSCDCNRSLFLSGWLLQLPCNDPGTPNRIAIDKITNRETGQVLDSDL